MVAVEGPGHLVDEVADHLDPSLHLRQGELDGLVVPQRTAEHDPLPGVGHGLVHAELGRAHPRSRLPDPILVHEHVRHLQALPEASEDGGVGNPHVVERELGVLARHVERPPHELDPEPGRVSGHHEAGDPCRLSRLTGGAGEHHVMGGDVEAGVEPLGPVDDPLVPVAHGGGLQPRGVRAVRRFREAESDAHLAGEHLLAPLLLCGRARVADHEHAREVADDGRLVLQVVVKSQPSGGQPLPDDGHAQVAAIRAAEVGGQPPAEEPRTIRPAPHLTQQLVPLLPRDPSPLEVSAGPLTAVVEEADVVVLVFQRPDLGLDEVVQVLQQLLDVGRDLEVHATSWEEPARPGLAGTRGATRGRVLGKPREESIAGVARPYAPSEGDDAPHNRPSG